MDTMMIMEMEIMKNKSPLWALVLCKLIRSFNIQNIFHPC